MMAKFYGLNLGHWNIISLGIRTIKVILCKYF